MVNDEKEPEVENEASWGGILRWISKTAGYPDIYDPTPSTPLRKSLWLSRTWILLIWVLYSVSPINGWIPKDPWSALGWREFIERTHREERTRENLLKKPPIGKRRKKFGFSANEEINDIYDILLEEFEIWTGVLHDFLYPLKVWRWCS
jgi:hypothetical protein